VHAALDHRFPPVVVPAGQQRRQGGKGRRDVHVDGAVGPRTHGASLAAGCGTGAWPRQPGSFKADARLGGNPGPRVALALKEGGRLLARRAPGDRARAGHRRPEAPGRDDSPDVRGDPVEDRVGRAGRGRDPAGGAGAEARDRVAGDGDVRRLVAAIDPGEGRRLQRARRILCRGRRCGGARNGGDDCGGGCRRRCRPSARAGMRSPAAAGPRATSGT
jgi:hypothetical protein